MGKASSAKKATKSRRATNRPSLPETSAATVAPGMALSPDAATWLGDGGTTSEITDEDREGYAQSSAELLDRVLRKGVKVDRRTAYLVVAVGWILFVGWLFSQDNGAGKLDTIEGIKWFFFAKVFLITFFAVVIASVIWFITED